MKKTIGFLMIGAVLGLMSPIASAYSAAQTAALKNEVTADKSNVLAIVSSKVSESPEDAGAIVKAAIEAVGADSKLVAAIVEAAATAAPDQITQIAESALSVAPDSLTEVQVFVAKRRDSKDAIDSKDATDSKRAVAPETSDFNPLDFPGDGIGPIGRFPDFVERGPIFLINVPVTSDVNP